MSFLITGKNGQLAQAFIRRFVSASLPFIAFDEKQLDITSAEDVHDAIAAHRPQVVINCAAYNLVDQAETESRTAYAVNADGPGILASAAEQYGGTLVHFGSDYVFDGDKEDGLYSEQDRTNPLNEYGKSKLLGEEKVRLGMARYLIFRLSWVYGAGSQNFIHKLKEWSENRDFLKITCDEFSVPTAADSVVDVVLRSIDKGITGRYHLTNSGFCSRYEWAKLVFETLGIRKFIRPVPMSSFKLPARRPNFSAMSNDSIAKLLGVAILPWDEAVRNFITGKSV